MSSQRSTNNVKASLVVGTADSANMTVIFSTFLFEVFTKFMEETGRFAFFPIAAAGSMIQMMLAWRQAKLDSGKKGTVAKALVETAGFLGITTAVVGGFVAASLFATVAPIIFTATVAFKSLYHAGAACFYWGKSTVTSDPDKKNEYKFTAKANAIGAVAGALASVAIGLVMIAAKPIFAILGVVAGLIGTVFSLYNLCKGSKNSSSTNKITDPLKAPLLTPQEDDISNSAKLHRSLSRTVSKEQPTLQSTANRQTHKLSPAGPFFPTPSIHRRGARNEPHVGLIPSKTM